MYLPVCSFDGHLWPRKKHLFYVAVGRNGDFLRHRLRFCPTHAAVVEEHLSEFEVRTENVAAGSANWSMVKCLADGEPVDQIGVQVYITGYPTQDERKDYWACLHDACILPIFLRDLYSNP